MSGGAVVIQQQPRETGGKIMKLILRSAEKGPCVIDIMLAFSGFFYETNVAYTC